MANDTKVYLPKQQVTRGVPGYRGKDVVVVDPKSGKQASAAEDAAASKAGPTVPQLRAQAEEMGLEIPANAKKADIEAAIAAASNT